MQIRQIKGLLVWALVLITGIHAAAQNKEVTGAVLDDTHLGVPGAYVVVKGETRGVMTDAEGKFTISVKPSDVLVAQFLGFADQEIKVGDQTNIVFNLVPQADMLEEVVMVAYGAQRKASVIGSIASVDMEQLKVPVGQLSTTLAGKLAGIVVMQHTGEPGAGADFWIRGMNTFGANSKPLVLVDGVERDMDLVDAEDIASFSILKDATATALYGVRGANGIVLITTKRGSESKPKITFKAESGMVTPTRLPELASAEQWIDYYNGLYLDRGSAAPISDYQREMYLSGADTDFYPAVDWIHTIFKERSSSNRMNLSVTGGTKNVRYYVGGNYYNEEGIFNSNQDRYDAGMSFDKFSFRSNVDINITKSTTLGLSLSNQFTDTNSPRNDRNEIYARTLAASPVGIVTVYSDGTLTLPDQGYNPWNLLNSLGYRTIKNNVAQATMSLTQDFSEIITEGLQANIKFSWDAQNQTIVYRSISPAYSKATGRDAEGNLIFEPISGGNNYMTLSSSNSGWNTMNLEASMTYERTFASAHRVSGMFLYNMRNRTNNVPGGSYIAAFPYKHMGVAGRATYSYKDRYFAEFNFGYNGSENFAPGHRFGFFPAVAFGWVPSNEKWWDPISKYISFFKIRYSNGKVGNSSTDGRFTYFTQIGGTGDDGKYSSYWGNDGLGFNRYGYTPQWSVVHKQDLGIEINFLDNELTFIVDLFKENRSKIFVSRDNVPLSAGFATNISANVGKVENKGMEASFEYHHQFGKDLYMSLRGNMAMNDDKVIENAQADPAHPWLDRRGHNVLAEWGYVAEGLYTSDQQIKDRNITQFGETYPGELVAPGDIMYKDMNGDGHIDEYDQVCISRGDVPRIYYGFGGDLRWKNVGLGILFQGVADAERILRGNGIRPFTSTSGGGTLYSNIADRWSADDPENTDVFYPLLAWGENDPHNINNFKTSTWWKRDFSFMRLKQFTISYYFPKSWTRNTFLSGGRFYLMGENVLTFSKFKLWDPELNTDNGISYPNVRTFSIGVNFNL